MATPPGRLIGKVAVVTGGGSGFGAAIAKRFVHEGAKVLVIDLREDAAKNVAHELGENATSLQADVSNAADWDRVAQVAISKYNQVDIVVNNAGASYSNKPTLEVTEREWELCFNVNVRSIFHSVRVFMPHLIGTEAPHAGKTGGSMVNIASTAALRPRPGLVWYNASKGAVINATQGLATEFGPRGVRVNSICPVIGETGMVATFLGQDTPETRERFRSTVPMGRFCQPEDVAAAAVWLSSDDASFVTGTNIPVDGGRCA